MEKNPTPNFDTLVKEVIEWDKKPMQERYGTTLDAFLDGVTMICFTLPVHPLPRMGVNHPFDKLELNGPQKDAVQTAADWVATFQRTIPNYDWHKDPAYLTFRKLYYNTKQ